MFTTDVSVVFLQFLVSSNAFSPVISGSRFRVRRIAERIKEPAFEDPNYDAHLPNFIKAGR